MTAGVRGLTPADWRDWRDAGECNGGWSSPSHLAADGSPRPVGDDGPAADAAEATRGGERGTAACAPSPVQTEKCSGDRSDHSGATTTP